MIWTGPDLLLWFAVICLTASIGLADWLIPLWVVLMLVARNAGMKEVGRME